MGAGAALAAVGGVTAIAGASSTHAGGDEQMPRREIDRAEHGEIADPSLAQGLHESASRAGHLSVYGSGHQAPDDSSIPKWVRSR